MKVVETFTAAKTGDHSTNEDVFVITDNFIAVIDGATPKSCPPIHGTSAGRFAAQNIGESITRLPADIGVMEALAQITQNLHAATSAHMPLDMGKERPAAAIVIYSRRHKQLWRVGDCPVRLDDALHMGGKLIDDVTAHARAATITMEIGKGMREDDPALHTLGRNHILPLLTDQFHLANKTFSPYCYGVIDGFPIPEQFIEVIDASEAQVVILASDGYFEILPTLAQTETRLTEILKEDPLLYKMHKSTKGLVAGNVSFDDRTYVRFTP